MNFELTIHSGSIQREPFAVRMPALSGFDLLDAARAQSGVKNLSPDRVTSSAFGCSCFHILVNEDFARESACFQSEDKLTVWATPGFLQKLLVPEFKIYKNNDTGEVIRCSVEWLMDKPALLSEWRNAGFVSFLCLNETED